MTDLTVVILTKNEEKNLRKCVESFRGVANLCQSSSDLLMQAGA